MKRNVKLIIASSALIVLCVCALVISNFIIGKDKLPLGSEVADSTQPLQAVAQIDIDKVESPNVIYGTSVSFKDDLDITSKSTDIPDKIDSALSSISAWGLNTVVFQLSESDSGLTSDGVTAAGYAAESASKNGIYSLAMMDFGDKKLNAEDAFALIRSAFGDSFCDSVIIGSAFADLYKPDELTAFIKDLGKLSSESGFSLVLQEDFESVKEQSAAELVESGELDGVYIAPEATPKSDNASFEETISAWSGIVGDSLIVEQSSELVSAEPDWTSFKAVLTQISVLKEVNSTAGLISCSFSDLNKSTDNTEILISCMNGTQSAAAYIKDFKLLSHSQTDFTVTESTLSFEGECNPSYSLGCNGKELPVTKKGNFSVNYTLKPGKNQFVFEHRGKTYTYNVTYNVVLIKSVNPTGAVKAPGGTVVEISTIALKAAKLTARVGSVNIPMTAGVSVISDDGEKLSQGTDYVTFTGSFILPKSTTSNRNLGKIIYSATYDGLSSSKSGASVTVSAVEVFVEPSEVASTATHTTATPTSTHTTEKPTQEAKTDSSEASESHGDTTTSDNSNNSTDTSDKTTVAKVTTTKATTTKTTTATNAPENNGTPLTPYTNHGLGTAKMCMVSTNYAETYSSSTISARSDPTATPLLSGIYDYITGSVTYDGEDFYNLASGIRIETNDVKLISKGYKLPSNSLSVKSSGEDSGGTGISLYTSWKVPFKVSLNGQNYIKEYYNGRPYAVTGFNSTSVDFIFYHTAAAKGSIDVSKSDVIRSAAWVKGSNSSYILRLTLKDPTGFYGYSVSWGSDGSLNITVKNKPSASLSGFTVLLDPGHGGSDPGACYSSTVTENSEAKIVLAIANKLKAKLEAKGATVYMTRTSNVKLSLGDRVSKTRSVNPDVFVSIHCNATDGNRSAYGVESYYYTAYSYPLASSIQSSLVSAYKNLIYNDSSKSGIDRSERFYPFAVTRVEECPAVLIECGYITNSAEYAVLKDSAKQEILAQALCNGIVNYAKNS